MSPPFTLTQEVPDRHGARCCPYCLRLLWWRYSTEPSTILGDPVCRVHGTLRSWYVLRYLHGRLLIVAVGRRRRPGWALHYPVFARRRPLHRRPSHRRRRSQTRYETTVLQRQLSLAEINALPVRGPDAHLRS